MTNQTVLAPSLGYSSIPPAPIMWQNNAYREGFFTGGLIAVVLTLGITQYLKRV